MLAAGCGSGVMLGEAGAFPSFAFESVAGEVCAAAADGLCKASLIQLSPWFFQRKYPNPTASPRAIRIKRTFPAPKCLGSSSSSSRYSTFEDECGSMLKLARVRRCGERSFNPRNDGPLIDGVGCGCGAGVLRGASEACGLDGNEAGGDDAGRCCELAATGGADSSAAPHMPQKRFPSEFSLPQREQRTHPSVYL